jgi:prepilin-type N-terminal cleavage/methylation domain-containing protein
MRRLIMQIPFPSSLRLAPRLALALLNRANRTQSGFTLIESLVAIIIVAIVVIGIIPPLFYATATRVQNRRAEQAAQLAQAEIDKVRAAVEQHASYTKNGDKDLPPYIGVDIHDEKQVAPPNFKGTAPTKVRSVNTKCLKGDDSTPLLSTDQYIAIDTDGGDECKPEFFVQIFRTGDTPTPTAAKTAPDGFIMGVRVYTSLAANTDFGVLSDFKNRKPAPLRGSQGLGFQATRPMAVLYSTIVRSDRAVDVYKQLCINQKGKGGC